MPSTQPRYVLPGDFDAGTTPAELCSRFGVDNVEVGELPGAEGATARGVVLFPKDTTRRAYLYFQDEQALRGLSLLRVFDPDSLWRLDNGVAIGMTLAELVERNGKPITYTGLGWDYGGTVEDLGGGTLTLPREGAIRSNWRLGPVNAGETQIGNRYPVGEASFASDDPRYPQQGQYVAVRELWVSFPGEDDL